MDPQRRLVALWFARVRAVLGLGLALFPRVLARLGVGPSSPTSNAAVRMVGVRDVGIGLGAVAEIREGTQAPEWLGWGAVADAVDALALLLTPGLPKRARLTGLFAAGGAVVGMKLAWDFADERAQRDADALTAQIAQPAPPPEVPVPTGPE